MKRIKMVRQLEYKCRKCGEVFEGWFPTQQSQLELWVSLNRTDKEITDLEKATRGLRVEPVYYPKPDMYCTHICSDGSLGLGDLIGGKKEIPEKEYFETLRRQNESY